MVTFTFLNHLKKAKKANKGDCTTAIIKKRIFRQISIFNIVMRYLNLSACNNVTLIIDYFREFFIFFYFKLINIANTKHSSRLILENFLFYKKKKILVEKYCENEYSTRDLLLGFISSGRYFFFFFSSSSAAFITFFSENIAIIICMFDFIAVQGFYKILKNIKFKSVSLKFFRINNRECSL